MHIQFQDVSNKKNHKFRATTKVQQTPKCSLCSVVRKEVVQAPKVWSTTWNQSTETIPAQEERPDHKLWKRKWVLF